MSRPRSSGKGTSKQKAREKPPARLPGSGKSGRDGRRAHVTPLVRVTGLGGVFFRSEDPKKLMGWYRKHLGIKAGAFGGWAFQWREKRQSERIGYTVFSPFDKDSPYFDPSEKPFMFNFRVADLHALIAQLRREGIHVLDDVQELPYGKFGWIIDPDGNKIELWEPPDVDDPFGESEV